MYPPIPTPPAQQPHETRSEYGQRLLCAMINDPTPAPIGPVLAGFSDDQIDAADRAAYAAVTARDIEPAAVTRIAAIRRTIAQTQQIRAAIDAEARDRFTQALQEPQSAAQQPPQAGSGGQPIPRPTPPPTRPPSNGYALPQPCSSAGNIGSTGSSRPTHTPEPADTLAF